MSSFAAGASYGGLERRLGLGGDVLLAVVPLALAAWVVRGRRDVALAAADGPD